MVAVIIKGVVGKERFLILDAKGSAATRQRWSAGWELWFAGFIQVEAWDNGSVGVFGGRNALIGKVL